jgi:flagellar export protein FliJ
MRKDPLDIVQMLAEISELEKSREVADSLVRLSAERERLALLEQYLSEYSDGPENEALDIEKLRSKRTFLTALAQAIGDQSASIDQINAVLGRRIETWREARANKKAVGRLTTKRAHAQALAEERYQQAEADAAGQRQRR